MTRDEQEAAWRDFLEWKRAAVADWLARPELPADAASDAAWRVAAPIFGLPGGKRGTRDRVFADLVGLSLTGDSRAQRAQCQTHQLYGSYVRAVTQAGYLRKAVAAGKCTVAAASIMIFRPDGWREARTFGPAKGTPKVTGELPAPGLDGLEDLEAEYMGGPEGKGGEDVRWEVRLTLVPNNLDKPCQPPPGNGWEPFAVTCEPSEPSGVGYAVPGRGPLVAWRRLVP